jgi:hypothetical protein
VAIAVSCLGLASIALAAQQVVGKVVDDRGAPRSGVQVRFEPGGKNATTNRDGVFKIGDLKDGDYSASIQAGSGAPQSFDVKVESGRLRPETLTLKSAEESVRGTVADRDGKALTGLEVTFAGPKNATVWTDSAGSFDFTGPPGDYEVTIEVEGKAHKSRVKIADGRLQPDTFTIE